MSKLVNKMPHSSVEQHSISIPSDSLLPKRVTSFPVQLPKPWLINQATNKHLIKSSSNYNYNNDHSKKPCNRWVTTLLRECATAIFEKSPSKINHYLWLLNELASPYGDRDQRLAYYFLQALFAKVYDSGASLWYENLNRVEEKGYSFDDKMKVILKFQEVSPWTTFGHVASNGAILEALEGDHNMNNNLHIIDLLSNTLCTQWPTLIEALATRFDETPSLRLTLVVNSTLEEFCAKEIRQRMEKFSRLMGVPFKLNVIIGLDDNNCLEILKKEDLGLQDGEAIVVSCNQALQRVKVDKREFVLNMIKSINPKIITIVEEEASLTTTRNNFPKTFEECLRFNELYFEMLEESFASISSERIRLERDQSRNITRALLACDDNSWMPNGAIEWTKVLNNKHGFSPFQYSNEVFGDVKALLKRYRDGYWDVIDLKNNRNNNNDNNEVGIYLTWKNEPVIWASVWKLN